MHVGLISLAGIVVLTSSSAAWLELPELPEGLAGCAIWAPSGRLQVVGGTAWDERRKIWSDQVWELASASGPWRDAGRLPYALAYAASIPEEGALWLLGGHDDREAKSAMLRLSKMGGAEVVDSLPQGWRFARGAAVAGRWLFLVRREIGDGAWQGAFVRIDPSSGESVELPPLPNRAWVLPAVAPAGGRLVVAGGASHDATTGGLTNERAIFAYDADEGTWARLGTLPVAARGMAAVALDSRCVLLAGGYSEDGTFQSAAYVLDAASGDLSPTSPLPFGVMPELCRAGEWIYSVGGEDAPRSRSRSVFRAAISDLRAAAEFSRKRQLCTSGT